LLDEIESFLYLIDLPFQNERDRSFRATQAA
jgi:hypothetical protein